jgi:hypothetical protein
VRLFAGAAATEGAVVYRARFIRSRERAYRDEIDATMPLVAQAAWA